VIEGAEAVDVGALPTLLTATPKPVIVDVSIGAAALPGSIMVPHPDDAAAGLDNHVAHIPPGSTILVVGNGFYGWNAQKAARRLVASHIGPVKWLVGGEEALAASGTPTIDERPR
jgi:hypothetical protein